MTSKKASIPTWRRRGSISQGFDSFLQALIVHHISFDLCLLTKLFLRDIYNLTKCFVSSLLSFFIVFPGSSSCPTTSCWRSCHRPRTHCVCSPIWRSALRASPDWSSPRTWRSLEWSALRRRLWASQKRFIQLKPRYRKREYFLYVMSVVESYIFTFYHIYFIFSYFCLFILLCWI